MRPGELRSSDDGTIVAGRAPSGEPRGDRHVLLRELLAAEAGVCELDDLVAFWRAADPGASSTTSWPSLRAADEALGVVAAAAISRRGCEESTQQMGSAPSESGQTLSSRYFLARMVWDTVRILTAMRRVA